MNDKTRFDVLTWVEDAVVYHLFPLGALGAERRREEGMAPSGRLRRVMEWIPHIRDAGFDTLLLGPVWMSDTHGYDTADLLVVDPRLGTNDDLWALVQACHREGLRVMLDAVFNHVGRSHPWFRDLQARGPASVYARSFKGLDFGRQSPKGDPFVYETWDGHWDLVKFDHGQPEVRDYLLEVARKWIEWFDIDGLRLDAADVVPVDFWAALRERTEALKPGFWLMGEQVFGDYRTLAGHHGGRPALHGCTNYEAYKGLWSSANDMNMHEIAWTINRQYGVEGIYRGLHLYTFADNHDVNRLASILKDPGHLYPVYGLLFTMPGTPSVYYGSETGLLGTKGHDDWPLRPAWQPGDAGPQQDLAPWIARLARLRDEHEAFRRGDYRPCGVSAQWLAFQRAYGTSQVLVVIHLGPETTALPTGDWGLAPGSWYDALDHEARPWEGGALEVPARGIRVLARRTPGRE